MSTAQRKIGQGTQAGNIPDGRRCDHPHCCRQGEYRAPRSRTLADYYWFCLDHVRDYNRAWNYYSGMTETEIEKHIRLDTVWQRPTWPMGARAANGFFGFDPKADPFDFFGMGGAQPGDGRKPGERRGRPSDTPEDRAMRAMDLTPPLTKEAVKSRYRALVKRFHPDIHGGDRTTEEKLKMIIEAYKTLMSSLNA